MQTKNEKIDGKKYIPNIRPINVLLVEDEDSHRELAKEIIGIQKIKINLAMVSEGDEALNYLTKKGEYTDAIRPDLILLDLYMPNKSGFEVLEEIKKNGDIENIPVFILTSSSANEDILESYQNYANGFLTKPISMDHFIKIVDLIDGFQFSIVVENED